MVFHPFPLFSHRIPPFFTRFSHRFTWLCHGFPPTEVGGPVFLYLVLRYLHRRQLLNNSKVLDTYGFLFAGFEPDFYYFAARKGCGGLRLWRCATIYVYMICIFFSFFNTVMCIKPM